MNIEGKVALVTGGSGGIGRAIVQGLAEHGAHVYFSYRKQEKESRELAREIQGRGGSLEPCYVDTRCHDGVAALVRKVTEQRQRIDILVNNAGITRDGLLLQMKKEDFDQVIATNLAGVFHMTRQVLPFMVAQRSGKIINISSVAATSPGPGHANYAASKGGINSFTKALAIEVGKRHINVNAIAPGLVETEMTREVRRRFGSELLSSIPLGRFAQPEDVAQAVLFLASSMADYVTGEVIQVSGGYKM